MIEKLTKKQEEQLVNYRDKWLKIGLSTDRVNWKTGKYISDYYYKNIVNKSIVPVVVLSSPLYTWVAVCMFEKVESQVWNQVRSQVRSQVKKMQLMDFVYPWLNGHFMSSYFSYYNFMNEVLGIKFDVQEKYDWYQKTSEVGLIYPLKNICIISDRPEKIKMKNGLLHSENSPSIQYTDGFSIWSLNGILVPQWLVETPAEKIDPQLALKETNADVQREIIRKIGAEKMLKASNAKLIDEADDPNTGLHYQLQEMVVGNIKRRYLYFQHASMPGVYYAKPIPIETRKALHGRAWILSLIEREELKNVDTGKEAEIIANFPGVVS